MKVYMPCFDSVNFLIGKYGVLKNTPQDVVKNTCDAYRALLFLSDHENIVGVLTLNQICDSRFIGLPISKEFRDELVKISSTYYEPFELIIQLINDEKIVLSTYGKHSILDYSIQLACDVFSAYATQDSEKIPEELFIASLAKGLSLSRFSDYKNNQLNNYNMEREQALKSFRNYIKNNLRLDKTDKEFKSRRIDISDEQIGEYCDRMKKLENEFFQNGNQIKNRCHNQNVNNMITLGILFKENASRVLKGILQSDYKNLQKRTKKDLINCLNQIVEHIPEDTDKRSVIYYYSSKVVDEYYKKINKSNNDTKARTLRLFLSVVDRIYNTRLACYVEADKILEFYEETPELVDFNKYFSDDEINKD